MDISESMLDVARDREVEGDLCLHDLGDGLPLRTGTFDGAISISAVQWLCNAVSRLPAVGGMNEDPTQIESTKSQHSVSKLHTCGPGIGA